MKIASLLAQFLYSNKKLNLPTIGTFTLEPLTHVDLEAATKSGKSEGIVFTANPSTTEDPEFISYISTHTGKMKALAKSDFQSYIELAQELLNIGKPFVVEGLGSITKKGGDVYEFTETQQVFDRKKNFINKEKYFSDRTEAKSTKFENDGRFNSEKQKQKNFIKPILFMLSLAALGFATWFGYKALVKYQQYKAENKTGVPTISERQDTTHHLDAPITHDTITNHQNIIQQDTTQIIKPPIIATNDSINFKFIIETASKERALKRYAQLKSDGLKIELIDSLNYKLYYVRKVRPSDTLKVLQNMKVAYTPKGKFAYVEKQ